MTSRSLEHPGLEQKNQCSLNPARQKWVRLILFLFCSLILVIGRITLPDHNVSSTVDTLMDALAGVTEYLIGHPQLRAALLICSSLFMDAVYITTGYYWISYGKTSRLLMSILIFYVIRGLVQFMWYSPYPLNYHWDYPGFPSIVVPYGRNSDFYFSGHIGFVVINACEWLKNDKPWAAFTVALGGVYIAFILLVYQVHYSIDIFTGIICAGLVFMLVDKYKEKFDGFFIGIYSLVNRLFRACLKWTGATKLQRDFIDDSQSKIPVQM